ncbi:hypothetical protein PR202_gb11323 [Eleusine coracana subsp. coracana]|uniref:Nucleobase-ascorbate transporter LPE1 n=1 Tax=Eleusine coracana subsp. coracana TaxID=191504 RepID=A0AAV5ELH8_ELECO|nr:hypothetical protein PR202_gb11323 [Eleusine coracana subsp. coracana]
MSPVKAEELVPFPVKEQFGGLDYCITSPPPWITTVLLGFQHYLVMLGTTVLIATIIVPLMGGGHEEKAIVIQTILFLAGINTLLQVHFGTRLPAVMGGSYTYIYPAVAIILSPRYALFIGDPLERFVYTMRSLQGALIIAGVFQAVIGFFGIWRIFIRFLTPLAAVPFVTLSGLGLFYFTFPGVAKCIEVGLPALILFILFAEYAAHFFVKGSFVFGRCAVLVTVVIVWIYAEILTAAGAYNERGPITQTSCRTDRAGIIQGSGFPIVSVGVPDLLLPRLLRHDGCFFRVTHRGSIYHTGRVMRYNNRHSSFSVMLSTLISFSTSVSKPVQSENYQPAFVASKVRMQHFQCSTVWLHTGLNCYNSTGKFGALLASVPLPLFSALYCVLFAYTAGAGLSLLQYCNLNSLRTKFILSVSLFLGLSIPQYFRVYEMFFGFGPVHTHSVAFNVMVNVIFSSPATVAAILAYLLDCTHLYWEASVRKDSGWHWWEKFKSYRHDARSEEFYSLPYGLSRYFPSF